MDEPHSLYAAKGPKSCTRAAGDIIGDLKILVIGATGTIGSAVTSALEASHQVVKASRGGPTKVDLEDPSSLDELFAEVPDLDAVVCCAASGPLVDLESAKDDEIAAGLQGKLLGQVALASELPRGLRINLIRPGWIKETLDNMGVDGTDGTPVSTVARAYVQAVEGTTQGQTIRP